MVCAILGRKRITFQNSISKVSKWQLDMLVLSFHNCMSVCIHQLHVLQTVLLQWVSLSCWEGGFELLIPHNVAHHDH